MTIESWVREALAFYRPLGFFSHYQGSDAAVVSKLARNLLESSSDTITEEDLDAPEFDLFFLSLDPLRCLYSSMHFGEFLAPGNDAYVASLEALAAISRGAFKPTNIKETWDTPEGPIRLSFDFEAMPREIKIETWDGAFDFRILLQLNGLLAKNDYRFEMAPLDDILFVTVLGAQERYRLEQYRELAFMVLSLPRTFRPLQTLGAPLALPDNPETRTFYVGTLNENLDRCVGRLRFILHGDTLEGHHQFIGDSHREDFVWEGSLERTTSKAKGTLSGDIEVEGERIAYEGVWSGTWCPGNLVATGVWEGWFVRDRGPNEKKPRDGSKIYRGQWGLLEESFSRSQHPYLRRVRSWLETVWQSRSSADYPWLLTLEE